MIDIKTRLNNRRYIFKNFTLVDKIITRGATETFVFDIDKYNEKYNKEYTTDNFYQVSFLFKQGEKILNYTYIRDDGYPEYIKPSDDNDKFILTLSPDETIKFNETGYYNFDEYDLLRYEVMVQASETVPLDASAPTSIEDSCFIGVKDSIYAEYKEEENEE